MGWSSLGKQPPGGWSRGGHRNLGTVPGAGAPHAWPAGHVTDRAVACLGKQYAIVRAVLQRVAWVCRVSFPGARRRVGRDGVDMRGRDLAEPPAPSAASSLEL